MKKIEIDAGLLYDFAVSKPDGFTYADAVEEFGWDRAYFFAVVREVRLDLAGDSITLPCVPQGHGELWLYTLIGGSDESGKKWQQNRIGDTESRLQTMEAVSSAIARDTDGRSVVGKKARKISRVIGRLIEDLDEINEGASR